MKVIAYPSPSGSAYWRLHDPFKYLRKKGMEAFVSDEGVTEKALDWADICVLQNVVDKDAIALAYAFQQEKGKKIIVECDDLMDLNEDNPHELEHKVSQSKEVFRRTMEVADAITTTNDYLGDKLRQINPNVLVLPNYLDLERWDLPKKKNNSKTLRIVWAGSLTHLKDLEMIAEPLTRICKEFPQVRLIFVGETRIAEKFPEMQVETMLGVPFEWWPRKLNELQADISLAPLRDTEFNRCKSNIKWQEYAIAKIPGVYSPTVYGERGFDGRFGLVAYDPDHWYRAIKNLILYPQLRNDLAEAAYTHVTRRFSLEKHIHEWEKIYNSLV